MVERQQRHAPPSTFAALGHPVRCAIVERLRTDEARVTDLARAFPISLAAVSKHIVALEAAGVVRRRIEGRTHWLSLDPRPLEAARAWLDGDVAFWAGRLDALADALLTAEQPAPAARDATGERSA
jgi:DNA-binding transcriptional ArsR family regulator